MIYSKREISAAEYTASLYTYLLDSTPELNSGKKRPVIIICPGGGYEMIADRESEPMAIRMNAAGFHAVVLWYSIRPAAFPTALIQLAKTVALLREHSDEWNVDPDRVFVMGFSAGGHLAASLGVLWNKGVLQGGELALPPSAYRPNGMILGYPVINSGEFAHRSSFDYLVGKNKDLLELVSLEKQVDRDTPPTFLWHTFEDTMVPVENSLLFAEALRKYGIPFEMHIYQYGVHGLSLVTAETETPEYPTPIPPNADTWVALAIAWIRALQVS